MGEWEAAHDFLDKAILMFEEIADMYNWANSMDNLVDLYEAQGDIGQCCAVLERVLLRLQNIDPDAPEQKLLTTMQQRLQALSRND
jgi:hypothetical protein